MQEPKYIAGKWVVFRMGESHFFGEIIGGRADDDGWYYLVTNPTNDQPISVKESDILMELNGTSWEGVDD